MQINCSIKSAVFKWLRANSRLFLTMFSSWMSKYRRCPVALEFKCNFITHRGLHSCFRQRLKGKIRVKLGQSRYKTKRTVLSKKKTSWWIKSDNKCRIKRKMSSQRLECTLWMRRVLTKCRVWRKSSKLASTQAPKSTPPSETNHWKFRLSAFVISLMLWIRRWTNGAQSMKFNHSSIRRNCHSRRA